MVIFGGRRAARAAGGVTWLASLEAALAGSPWLPHGELDAFLNHLDRPTPSWGRGEVQGGVHGQLDILAG